MYYTLIMEESTKKTEVIHQRIDPVLKERLKKAAKKDRRSMSGAVVIAIEDYIKKIGE